MAKQQRILHASFRPCRDYMIALVPLFALAWYLYGPRVIILAGFAAVTALVCDVVVAAMRRVKYDASDISSYMFAFIFVIMLPASTRYEIVIIGTMATVLLGKHAFGGYGAYPFHPAAFGFAFASVCWSDQLYLYPTSLSNVGIGFDSGAVLSSAVASELKHGGSPAVSTLDLVLGNYPGPMGTTFCIIILSCLVLLIVHGAMTWHIPVMYLFTCAAWAIIFPRTPLGSWYSLIYEMLSGAIIFAAVFLVAEPTTVPGNPRAKIVYGVLLGVGTMLFRTFGRFEMGICFAILLVNPLSAFLDRKLVRTTGKKGARI